MHVAVVVALKPGNGGSVECVRGARIQGSLYGPGGRVATKDLYQRLGVEFDQYATEPLPRVNPTVFPRDIIRAYRRKP